MRGALTLKPSYYDALKRLTLELAGVRMGSDHAFLVETRLANLAREEGFETLDAMIQALFKDGQTRLAIRVVSTLVERDTHFFRDPTSMRQLLDIALEELVRLRGGGRIDVLCYGCGSGQDVYGLAMRLRDRAEAEDPLARADISVMGVDYPSQALDRAKAGRYTHFEVQRGLPIRDLVRYFEPDGADGDDWIVKDELRRGVEFRDMHLLSDTETLGTFHAVMFRGALPRYSPPAQVRVLRGLSKLLRPGGFLILGSEETLGEMNFGLDAITGHPNVYRKREVVEVVPEPEGKKPVPRTRFESGPKRRRRSLRR